MGVRRHGLVLNTAFACLLLLVLMVASYFLFVRGQARLTQNVLAGEKAYHLAQGGVAAGIGYFTNTKDFAKLYRDILAGKPASSLNGSTEVLPPDAEVLQRMISAARGDASVTVELALLGFRTFGAPDPGSGITADPVEKRGILKVTSTADYVGSKRRVVAYKEVKIVNVIPYVVSKFTLFSAERAPGDSPNLLKMKKVDLTTSEPKPENKHAPLFFKHGTGRNPEDNGWVFLGGDLAAKNAWVLNMTWGEKGWGEQFQLLKRPWELTRSSSTATPLAAAYHSMLLQRGFFDGVQADNKLFAHFGFDQPAPSPTASDDPVGEGANVIRLYGAPASQTDDGELDVSPTYVLGPVFRRYMDLRYVKRLADSKTVYAPYASDADFAAAAPAPWPVAPAFDVKNDVFQNIYPFYADYMSTVTGDMRGPELETYNRAHDFLDEPQEVEPAHKLAPTKVTHATGNAPGFLYDPALNNGYVAIANAAGRELFRGWLHQLVSADLRIPERATFRGDAGGFSAWIAHPPRVIPGIVYFAGGDIVIDRPLKVDSGGIVAADGNITVAAAVTVEPGGLPLSLVSLNGSVRINTAGPVQASLVALGGSVVRETGAPPLKVRGNVIARRLSFADLCEGREPGKIIYDTRLDPTAAGAEANMYTVQLSPWRSDYMPPVD